MYHKEKPPPHHFDLSHFDFFFCGYDDDDALTNAVEDSIFFVHHPLYYRVNFPK
jgi:hypothetical protein